MLYSTIRMKSLLKKAEEANISFKDYSIINSKIDKLTPYFMGREIYDAIKNSTTLNQEESRLAAAEALWEEYLASGGSALDPEVRDAYEDFISLKAQIEASVEMCLTFMGYVEAARVAWVF